MAFWISECPSIPGCVSQGKTKVEAIGNIKDAIALCLEVRAEKGLPSLQHRCLARIGRCVNIRGKQMFGSED